MVVSYVYSHINEATVDLRLFRIGDKWLFRTQSLGDPLPGNRSVVARIVGSEISIVNQG